MTPRENFENLLRYAAIGLVAVASFQVIRPFLGALLWAGVLFVSTWQPFRRIELATGAPRKLLALLMAGLLLIVFVVPLALLGGSLAHHVQALARVANDLTSMLPQTVPSWLDGVPLIGPMLRESWEGITADSASLASAIQPWIGRASHWLLAQGAHVLAAIAEILLAIVVTGLLYLHAETAAHWVRTTAERISAGKGPRVVGAVVRTVRAVMLGVVGMAVAQATLMALGLAVAGVPAAPLLGFVSFVLALAQVGTSLVWIPAALWLFYHGQLPWSLALVAWGTALNTVDHFVKPVYISQELGLPLIVIFMGVIGGVLTWGLIGAFLGATLLAVCYTLYKEWIED
ncbi:MAG: AI-2E family transporter [Gammaproteobacteria bacterium]|nr:AI-2E family transporter [Gammaproteobacteria bacterium]